MSVKYFEAEHHVSTYNKFRPSPPKKLIEYIVQYTTEKIPEPLELAVDVGCGSGQSTEVLAPYFKKIIGLDSSDSIIREARKKSHHLNIYYSASPGENMDLNDNSVDLVTVGQAVHWFDLPKFYSEANRILKRKGVLATYAYHLPLFLCENHSQLENLPEKYYTEILSDFTLPQSRKAYLEKYTSKEFNEINFVEGGHMKRVDGFTLETEGSASDLVGYVASWSAFQNYVRQMGKDNGTKLLKQLKNDISDASSGRLENQYKIQFNYFLLIGRKN